MALGRRWAPRHLGPDTVIGRFRNRSRRVRRRTSDLADLPDPGCAAEIGEAIAVFVIAVVVALFLALVGQPLPRRPGRAASCPAARSRRCGRTAAVPAAMDAGRLWAPTARTTHGRSSGGAGAAKPVGSSPIASQRPAVPQYPHRRTGAPSRRPERQCRRRAAQDLDAAFDIAAAVLVQVAVRRNGPCETLAFPRPTRTSPLSDTRTLKQSLLKPRGWVLQALSVPRRCPRYA